MKAFATESRRHRGKAFFLFSVSLCLRSNFLSRQTAQRKRKALLSVLRVLCGFNSNLSTCINPHVYEAFKLKSVPLIEEQLPGAICALYSSSDTFMLIVNFRATKSPGVSSGLLPLRLLPYESPLPKIAFSAPFAVGNDCTIFPSAEITSASK